MSPTAGHRGFQTSGLHGVRPAPKGKPIAREGHALLPWAVPDWTEQALCAQSDPESFFPEKGGSTLNAKRVCARCPVRLECLEMALANDERYGFWGGLSERERRKLKRRRRTA